MDIVAIIAENKIREAMERGEFDNLPGRGRPLQLDDLSGVPEELRASYLILKNAGVLPPELELHREIMSLKQLVDLCYQEEEKQQLTRKLNEKILRFNLLMERRGTNAAVRYYREKIYRKLGRGF
ncbi:protein of unknown function [Desulfofundulus australicus DSM 11792]|jgi:hypothetical protein|uniref:DnaJ homologue subfamily C member 28 conserved domain-containing protein n=1 Tax=Desulfofundulus australicus DSM 11792 TaxID=1121425 RepID=A0A1M4Z720_9FIRM|nr:MULTISPECIES: DnaJ family domain-containing protein [Desulfofundulus]SHF13883.1 protein of unknown function [Desulfofundulus australicus DSM 11792]